MSIDCFAKQIEELEIMESMFFGPDEFSTDLSVLGRIKSFVESGGGSTAPDGTIVASLKLPSAEIEVRLPREYPVVLPQFSLSAPSLSREDHKCIQVSLDEYLGEQILEVGLAAMTAQWLIESVERLNEERVENAANAKETEVPDDAPKEFMREWLYFHHMYSKTKRKHIQDWAHDKNLTGFAMPGKPGLVCVEGERSEVLDYYASLRSLSWKKMTSRLQQIETCDSSEASLDSFRRFSGFEELELDMHGQRNNHADIGQLVGYLREHGLEDVFDDVFPNTRNF